MLTDKFVNKLANNINETTEFPVSRKALAHALLNKHRYQEYVKNILEPESENAAQLEEQIIEVIIDQFLGNIDETTASEKIKELIANGANVDKLIVSLNNPIYQTLLDGLPGSVDFLMEPGFNPLFFSILYAPNDIISIFIKAGANLNIEGLSLPYGYLSPLMFAIFNHADNCEIVVQELIDHGADIDYQNNLGSTALMMAVSPIAAIDGRLVDLLLKNKASLDIIDRRGETALMMAVNLSNPAGIGIVQSLLDNGASIDLKSNQGETALSMVEERLLILQDQLDDTAYPDYIIEQIEHYRTIENMLVDKKLELAHPELMHSEEDSI